MSNSSATKSVSGSELEVSVSSDRILLAASAPTRRQLVFFSWTKDLLIYIVVLNLFVEYVDQVVIDSFTVSILTAILLKALLEIILGLKRQVARFLGARPGNVWKFLRITSTWLILFLSKFLILKVEDLVFGDRVELGNFVQIYILVIAMMIARAGVQWIYISLGSSETASAESA